MEAMAAIPLVGELFGGGAAAAGAGAAAAGAGASILPTVMKAAPLVMGAGSLLTKDKTLKDLLGIGSLVAGGANLISGIGGGPSNVIEGASNDPVTGATIPPSTAPPAPPIPTTTGSRLSDVLRTTNEAAKFGSLVAPKQPNPFQFQMPPPGQNLPTQPIPPPAPIAPSYTPGAGSPAAQASYKRFLEMVGGQGY